MRYVFNKRYHSSDEVLNELQRIESEQLPNDPAIADNTFQMMPGTTVNQGTRPGVIDTDSALDNTQILPEDWLNDMQTRAENEAVEDPSVDLSAPESKEPEPDSPGQSS